MTESIIARSHLFAIDPGTTKLGFCVVGFDPHEMRLLSIEACTLLLGNIDVCDQMSQFHEDRIRRILGFHKYFRSALEQLDPSVIVFERPFHNPRTPGAFRPLVEVIHSVRMLAYAHDCYLPVMEISPSSVKNAVGAAGNAGKEVIREKILGNTEITSLIKADVTQLGPDALDSIAVGLGGFNYMRSCRLGVPHA